MDLITISDSLMKSDTMIKSNKTIRSLSSVKSDSTGRKHKSTQQTGGGQDDEMPKAGVFAPAGTFINELVETKLKNVLMRTHKLRGGMNQNQSEMNDDTLTESAKSESEKSILSQLENLSGGASKKKTKKYPKKKPVTVVIDRQRKYNVPTQKAGHPSEYKNDSVKDLLEDSESSLFTESK
jgi:hypothetical protein